VVILGPAKNNTGFEKRSKIKEHLMGLSTHYDVAFPEEIKIPPGMLPDDSEWTKINYIVGNAEVIIALLIDDIKVTGVLTEISKYSGFSGFREKAFLLVPKERTKWKRGAPLIWESVKDFPRERKLSYTDDEFATCNKIRDFAGSVVDAFRKQATYKIFQEKHGMRQEPI